MVGIPRPVEAETTGGLAFQSLQIEMTVSEALLSLPPAEAIPTLKRMATKSCAAAWALIRLRDMAGPTIIEILREPQRERQTGVVPHGQLFSRLLCPPAGPPITRYQMYLPIRPDTRPDLSFWESRTTLPSGNMPSGMQVKSS
jgi:hypothetical protein